MTQKRTPREIAQSHADKAVEAVERHAGKIEKAQERLDTAQSKVDKAAAEVEELEQRRQELVEEADYRQAHPLLKKAEEPQGDGEYNPFA